MTETSTNTLVQIAVLNPKFEDLILKLKSLHRIDLNSGSTFKQCISLYVQEGIAYGQFKRNLELLNAPNPESLVESFVGVNAEYIDGDWIIEGQSYNKSNKFISLTTLY
jgi:hypothetical protein